MHPAASTLWAPTCPPAVQAAIQLLLLVRLLAVNRLRLQTHESGSRYNKRRWVPEPSAAADFWNACMRV